MPNDLPLPDNDHLIFKEKVIITIGIKTFEESLISQGVEVIDVKWFPPKNDWSDLSSLVDDLI